MVTNSFRSKPTRLPQRALFLRDGLGLTVTLATINNNNYSLPSQQQLQ